MSEEFTYDRRRFLSTAAMTIAATQLGVIGSAGAQSAREEAPHAFADAVVEVDGYARHSS